MTVERAGIELISKSPAETFRIGCILGGELEAGDVVALTGELGSGKTCLTQGVASGFGVPEGYVVTSPTFTLINEYPGREELPLFHADLYRLQGETDLADTGFEECLSFGGVTVIEWAERIRKLIPERAFHVEMAYLEEDVRKIMISGCRARIDGLAGLLKKGGD